MNRGGKFNVPLGRYKNPRILDEDNLRRVSAALQGVEVVCQDFEEAVSGGGSGDLIYFDPPYQPLSPISRFTAYTSEGFDLDAQERLAQVFQLLDRDGATPSRCNVSVSSRPSSRLPAADWFRSSNSPWSCSSAVRASSYSGLL